jgi:hypothetical protein
MTEDTDENTTANAAENTPEGTAVITDAADSVVEALDL